MSMKEPMAEYLRLYKNRNENFVQVAQLNAANERIDERMITLRDQLKDSVQPRCGSATKPARRIYTDGQYTTLIVEWGERDDSPRICIQEPEG